MGSVRERMAQFERRPGVGGELDSTRLSRMNSATSDIARRISLLEVPTSRHVPSAGLKAAAEAVTPPPQAAPRHPRGVFLPLHVRTPETSPRGGSARPLDADDSPRAAPGFKKGWRIASPKSPAAAAAPLADAASSYELGAAFRSCELNNEGTIPVRELGFGLAVLVGASLHPSEPEAALHAAGLRDATRLTLEQFGSCARELGRARREAAAAAGVQRRLTAVHATATARDENAEPAGFNVGARLGRAPALGGGGGGGNAAKPQPGARPAKELSSQLLKVHSMHAGTVHSFAQEEAAAFSRYLSAALSDDSDVSELLPISSDPASLELFEKVRDGVLLCKLVNLAQPDAIDERAINTTRRLRAAAGSGGGGAMPAAGGETAVPPAAPRLSLFQLTENHNLAISAAKAIGCHVINIDASDMLSGTPHLVLGLMWQLVKMALLASVNLSAHPGLAVLLRDGEQLSEFSELCAEHVLLRWLNWHLDEAGRAERVRNFGKDIADSVAYTVLLHRICPESVGASLAPLDEPDAYARAEAVVETAARLGDVSFAISARDITAGNEKLNLAFVAALFNAAPGLALISADEAAKLAALRAAEEDAAAAAAIAASLVATSATLERAAQPVSGLGGVLHARAAAERERLLEESREERAFRMWLNSLGIDRFVGYLFDDCRDGAVLLQAMDVLKPSIVRWRARVNRRPRTVYEIVENANYAVEICAQPELVDAAGAAAARAAAQEADALAAHAPRASLGGGRLRDEGGRMSYGCGALPGAGGGFGAPGAPPGGAAGDGFGLSLVGVGGKDLHDGNRMYILAVIWQLMRYHLLHFIALSFEQAAIKKRARDLAPREGVDGAEAFGARAGALPPPPPPPVDVGSLSPPPPFGAGVATNGLLSPGAHAAADAAARREAAAAARAAAAPRAPGYEPITEEDVLRWANEAVARAGSTRRIDSFRERSLCTGRFLIELLAAVEPRSVDPSLVQPVEWDLVKGAEADACALNAKYAISVARKMGAAVFCLWEDVVEVRPKLVFAFVAALMARQLELQLD
ncbi:hypothetical protein KFE25_014443 [Diacronema lutheri]|uniref:Calponin-homology (CH) domain-containing protein n=1 Tax=Diacronema lutheri TaxID=2081491 RepID=A0A8J5X695_DIALT|nr:hypothetical protein KFE25_014443 [Diacronema lutheri]